MPGGRTAEAPRREEGARARGHPEGLRGKQQLHQERQGKTGAEDGGHQGESGGSACCHVGEAAGKGQREGTITERVWETFIKTPHLTFKNGIAATAHEGDA